MRKPKITWEEVALALRYAGVGPPPGTLGLQRGGSNRVPCSMDRQTDRTQGGTSGGFGGSAIRKFRPRVKWHSLASAGNARLLPDHYHLD